MSERTKARTEVIEGEATAKIHHTAGKCLALVDVAHEGSLGDLKHEVGRVGSRLIYLLFDDR